MGVLPTNYSIAAGTLLEGFEDHTSWTFAGTGSKADNTTGTFIKSGSKSLRIQGQTSGSAVVHKAATLNFTSGTLCGLWVYDNGTAGTLLSIEISLATDSTNANRYSYKWDSTNVSIVKGWNVLYATRDMFTKTGTITWADADYLRIQVNSTGVGGCDVYLDSLYRSFYTRPMVMFHFDDNNATAYTAGYAYLDALGIRGTFAFQGNNIDVANAMTTAQMNTAYEAGWDVTNHTYTHANLTSITSAQRFDELGQCRDIMEANGWTRTINYFVAPQGGLNNDAVADLEAAGFTLARGGRSLFTDAQQSTFQGVDNVMRLVSKDVGNSGVSLATAKGYVDTCIRLGTTLMLVFHKLDAVADSLTWTTDDYEALVDYVYLKQQSNLLDIPTLYEWVNGFTVQPRKKRWA
jgi:peptidoglycan/xylan/chitin deacetylase (PgdA/CDA1 family)